MSGTVATLFRQLCGSPPCGGPCANDTSSRDGERDASHESSVEDSHTDSSSSSSPTSSSSSSSSSASSDAANAGRIQRRRKQTEAAQKAAVAAKLKRKMAKELAILPRKSDAEHFIPDLQPNCELNKPGPDQSSRKGRWRRLRLIFSYFKAACSAINSLFQEDLNVSHVVSVSILDDTNVTLSKTVQGQWQSSRVVTVLNNCQACTVCYDSGQQDPALRCWDHKSFQLHTPPTCLPRANAPSIFAELRDWLFSFAGKVGAKWQHFGVRPHLLEKVPIVAQTLCFDSLKTNVKIMKMLKQDSYQQKVLQDTTTSHGRIPTTAVLLGIPCSVHQLALCRKSLLFHYNSVWSSIVRLAHLYESHNFRAQFRSALFSVLEESFQFICVQSAPSQAEEWRQERRQLFGLLEADSCNKLRRRHHRMLAVVDNGDVSSPLFTHWCYQNNCCKGNSTTERTEYCLMMLCKYYYFLFGFGFHVPLAYRWKHAKPALMFCEAPCLR